VVTVDERMTTSAAARVAGVSEQTIRSWAKSGRLPVIATPLGMLIDPVTLGTVIAEREAAQREKIQRGARR
jgi:predicted site-specific integrase-resolvase